MSLYKKIQKKRKRIKAGSGAPTNNRPKRPKATKNNRPKKKY